MPRGSSASGAELPVATRRSRGSKKQDTDPNRPKKPASGYFLFLTKNRAKIVDEVGSSKPAGVAAKASAMWKALDQAVRDKYQAQYQKAHESYKEELAAYLKTDAAKDFEAVRQEAKQQEKENVVRTAGQQAPAKGTDLRLCSDEELLAELARRLNEKNGISTQTDDAANEQGAAKRRRTSTTTSSVEKTSTTPGFTSFLDKKRAKIQKILGEGATDEAIEKNAMNRWKELTEELKQRWEESAAA